MRRRDDLGAHDGYAVVAPRVRRYVTLVCTRKIRRALHRCAGCLPIPVWRDSLATEEMEQFVIVINAEEQYSIWPEHKVIPAGWRRVGEAAGKEACLETIKTLWTDMRPLSLRQHMEAQQPIVASERK